MHADVRRGSDAGRPVRHRAPAPERRVQEAAVGGGPVPASFLALQRAVGNAAVARMIARREDPGAGETAESWAGVQRVLRSPGRALEGPVRAEMEARLGADFSSVRVHRDMAAQRSAARLGARAYTAGEHVVIGRGGTDRHTLAHELTHVVQQRSGPVAGADNGAGLRVSDPSDRFEREAESTARRVLSGPARDAAAEGGAGTAGRPSGPGAVQRAVGFEFETPLATVAVEPGLTKAERRGERFIKQYATRGVWEPRDALGRDTDALGRGLEKKEAIVRVPGLFTVEADEASTGGSDLEFVTEAFPETDAGRAQLETAVSRIAAVAAELQQVAVADGRQVARWAGGSARKVSGPSAPRTVNGARRGMIRRAWGALTREYAVTGSRSVTANPQMTAGIDLARLPQFVDGITAPGQSAAPNEMAMLDLGKVQARARDRVRTFLDANQLTLGGGPAPASDRLRGLLTLVATYLIGGAESRGQAYVKGIAPLLARTDFAALFRLLPDEESQAFAADPDAFARLALDSAGLTGVDEPVFGGTVGLPPNAVRIAHVTRKAWLAGLVAGTDLMSGAGYGAHDWGAADPDGSLRSEFESMGSLGDRTDPGELAILELRRMRKNLPSDAWVRFALTAFDAVRRANP